MNLKFLEKKFKNLPKTGKIAEVFFLRMRFHLMRQSELKLRANKQFLLIDNDAQRTGGRFFNHSTVFPKRSIFTAHFFYDFKVISKSKHIKGFS